MAYQLNRGTVDYLFGVGVVSVLGEKIKEHDNKKALVVFDKNIEAAGIVAKVLASLEAAGIAYATFDGVHQDPSAECVDLAVEAGLAAGVDCVVGVGGGSSMDTAKASSIRLSGFEGKTADYVLQTPIYMNTTCPVFLVPTTCGTGAEITTVAIISRPELNVKWSVNVNTTLALVDPSLAVTLPPMYIATTGLDALAHAIEGVTSNTCNPIADECAYVAIRKIADYYVLGYEQPDNLEARTEMALAATFAGYAFNDPLTHMAHAMGDAFGCHYHTPHGQSCVFGLSATVKLVAPVLPEKMKKIAEAMRLPLRGNETAIELGIRIEKEIHRYMRATNIQSLEALGYNRDDVIAMAKEVAANHLTTHCPIPMDEAKCAELLAYTYDSYK